MNYITKTNGNKVAQISGTGKKAIFVEVDSKNNYVYAWSEMRCAGYNKAKVKIAKSHKKIWDQVDLMVSKFKELA